MYKQKIGKVLIDFFLLFLLSFVFWVIVNTLQHFYYLTFKKCLIGAGVYYIAYLLVEGSPEIEDSEETKQD